jgi:hypothetical protein
VIKNQAQALKDKKSQLLSSIKFRFSLMRNMQAGMGVLFSHQKKYVSKDFEYLDIFHDGTITNNQSIGEIIV